MIAALDHEGIKNTAQFYCSQRNEIFGAYTGERGRVSKGVANSPSCSLHRYGTTPDTTYQVNGNYRTFQSNALSYDGHSGYDFQILTGGSGKILAAADGDLIIPASDHINGRGKNWWYQDRSSPSTFCGFHTFKIRHSAPGGQWETWYLHAGGLGSPAFVDDIQKILALYTSDDFCSKAVTQDINLGPVYAGEHIANVGDYGTPGTPHLHFEVRRDSKIVDPYGWEWFAGKDPFEGSQSASPQVEPLWKDVLMPQIASVTLTPIAGGYHAAVSGENFDTINHVYLTLWDISKQVFHDRTGLLTSHTSTAINANLPAIPAGRSIEEFALKVMNANGPRSTPVQLSLSSSPVLNPVPLLLKGMPAPGGGTLRFFGGFDGFTDLGELYFAASVDTNGDDIDDDDRKLRLLDGQTNVASFPSVSKVGAVRVNESGGVAYGDAVSGTYPIYLRTSPSATPIKIVEFGQTSPISGLPFWESRGPLSISETGDVTFGACVYQQSNNTVYCDYLFMYEKATGNIKVLLTDAKPSPIGGTFNVNITTPNQFTTGGDIIFQSAVSGGSAHHGIFRYHRAGTVSKIAAVGDPAPPSIGGTYTSLWFDREGVSGDWLVFVGDITGGSADEVIVRVNLKTSERQVVAYADQPTGTAAGGFFAYNPSGSLDRPFLSGGWNGPAVRSDGAVVFATRLYNAVDDDNQPTDRGIFMWSSNIFTKIVVDGDDARSGGDFGGVSSFMTNNRGTVFFFVARID